MPSITAPLAAHRPVASLAICLLLAGCSTTPHEPAQPVVYPSASIHNQGLRPYFIRSDRYTLASTAPRSDQQDLLRQIVDIRIPDHLAPTVQDALTYTLRRSGYQLCPAADATARLFALPLPAAHYRLGPIPLREALKLLAGKSWQLDVDELDRQVCFSVRPEHKAAAAGAQQ